MAVRRLAETQPESFAFTQENRAWAEAQIAKFPEGRQASAVIALLWRAQEQEGWVTQPSIEYVADMLAMPSIRVLEVATFYTMFQLEPVGAKAHVQVCGTTPCMLAGSDDLFAVCRRRIHHDAHHLSADGAFSWEEVECLGACVNAPMVQIGKDTYEDLTSESFEALLDAFARGETPKPGPQNGRHKSVPITGPTTLTEIDYAPDDVPPGGASDVALAAPRTQTSAAKPTGLAGPRGGKADDLTRISGVGPVNEKRLHDLGVFHFDQVAAWSAAEIAWVDEYLTFHGRIEREDWVGQAKKLAAGAGEGE